MPAIHSTLHGFPSTGFMLDMAGVRVYISGDTDLFGDRRAVSAECRIVGVGGGPFTMGPEDAPRSCQWMAVSQAIPVHYAHNPLVLGRAGGRRVQARSRGSPRA